MIVFMDKHMKQLDNSLTFQCDFKIQACDEWTTNEYWFKHIGCGSDWL